MLGLATGITNTSYQWQPTFVDGMELWLRNGVGVAVAKWDDSSGNDNHAEQETGGSQATISNGGLDFDGSDDTYLLGADIVIAAQGSVNIFAVVNLDDATTNTIVGTGGNADFMEFQNKSTIRFHFDATASPEKINFGTDIFDAGTKFLVHQERISGSTGTLSTQINGSTVTPSGFTGDGADPAAFTLDRIGSRNNDRFLNGELLELLIYKNDSADMTDSNISKINNYLLNKHGL